MTRPEKSAIRVPDAIARAFLQDLVRQLDHLAKQPTRFERQEGITEHRFLALAFGMAEARHQCAAVQHDGRVGRKDQIR